MVNNTTIIELVIGVVTLVAVLLNTLLVIKAKRGIIITFFLNILKEGFSA